jgi:CRP/FNR family transcriptional regulator, cyclic AMP receptor protein
MQQDIFLGLKKIPLFTALSDEVLKALCSKARPVQFPKNSIIMHQGEISQSLHIILSGKVRVYISDEDKELILQTQETGSYYGELALFTNEPRSASIKTLEKTICAVIAKSDFMFWIQQYPEVATILLAALAEKVMLLTEDIQAMALTGVYQRLVRKLKQLAHEEEGVLVINNVPSQEELANMIGAGREMVNKVIRQLVFGGYILFTNKTCKIIKKFPKKYGP